MALQRKLLVVGLLAALTILVRTGTASADPAPFVTFPGPAAGISHLTAGPDGNVWFTEKTSKVGYVDRQGALHEFTVPDATSQPAAIAAGSDGNLWFSDQNHLWKVSPTGVFTAFPGDPSGTDLSEGSDGRIWYIDSASSVAAVATDGTIVIYPVQDGGTTSRLSADTSGNIWLLETGSAFVGAQPGFLPGTTAAGEIVPVTPTGIAPLPTLTPPFYFSGDVLEVPGGLVSGTGHTDNSYTSQLLDFVAGQAIFSTDDSDTFITYSNPCDVEALATQARDSLESYVGYGGPAIQYSAAPTGPLASSFGSGSPAPEQYVTGNCTQPSEVPATGPGAPATYAAAADTAHHIYTIYQWPTDFQYTGMDLTDTTITASQTYTGAAPTFRGGPGSAAIDGAGDVWLVNSDGSFTDLNPLSFPPPAVVPEVPLALLIPLTTAALLGIAVIRHSRRARARLARI